ncbi:MULTISPECIES: DUF1043 family protein [unclassified Methylophaga]|jgi:uncharacterized membrane-anchored protein YhcB (DUF1043 family)|uniref:YhcB family protein n=1 Tax=unclassified Methylophaga TaxID=2629249 RepID=UPI000C0E1662|nr:MULTISPECIES: DUF1043 family protein [unclassified Methylophaga]MBL1456986.1 DUF1043 family protein [Methylophaga sp.]|tara:strand:- start:187 stop:624 length:438 start_codon:yes stop_codon:yes gene_type:complete
MTSIEIWAIGIVAAVITGILGFLLGRRQPVGSPEQMKQLTQAHERQLAQTQAELDAYREEVHAYHEKTANLFVSIAAPYKEMFDHLTEGYDKLGNFTERKVLPDRAGALLDGPDANKHIPPELTEDLKPNPDYSKANPTAVQKDY